MDVRIGVVTVATIRRPGPWAEWWVAPLPSVAYSEEFRQLLMRIANRRLADVKDELAWAAKFDLRLFLAARDAARDAGEGGAA